MTRALRIAGWVAAAGLATAGCTLPKWPEPPPGEREPTMVAGAVIALLPAQDTYNVHAAVDAAGRVHVVTLAADSHDVVDFVISGDRIVDRLTIANTARWWDKGHGVFANLDAALDRSGALHALVDSDHYVLGTDGWHADPHTPWQDAGIKGERPRFVPGAGDLLWYFMARGSDVGARARWDVYGFGNALGGIIWPWRTHGHRVVVASAAPDDGAVWVAIAPRGRPDTYAVAVSGDHCGNVQMLYTQDVGGLLSTAGMGNGMPAPEAVPGIRYVDIGADQLAMPAREPRPADGHPPLVIRAIDGPSRTFTGSPMPGTAPVQIGPVSLAADPAGGKVLVGMQWLRVDGEWRGPLRGSLVGYGHVVASGEGRFHALIAGPGLYDWRKKTRDVPVVYAGLEGEAWSRPFEVGRATMKSVLGWLPQSMGLVAAPDGAVFVIWPSADGLVGRWLRPVPPAAGPAAH